MRAKSAIISDNIGLLHSFSLELQENATSDLMQLRT